MLYTPINIEQKTSTGGKPYASVTLADDQGNTTKCSVWDGLELLRVGSPIDGAIIKNGAFSNFRPSAAPKPQFKGSGGIANAVAVKNEHIKEAQERKNESISIHGAFRDATLITLAALKDQPFPSDEDFKAEWTRWAKWILSKHDEPFL